MTETVRFVLTGRLLSDVQPEEAIRQLAAALDLDLTTTTRFLHTAPTVIKQQVAGEQVEHYLQIFARIGVEVTVVPETPAIVQKQPQAQPKKANRLADAQNDADTDYETPPFFALQLKGRLGRTRYIINLMASILPCVLAAILLPGLMMRDPTAPGAAAGWLLMVVLAPLLLWTAWQYFRCVALRLHDLNLSAYWAGLFALVFLLSQLVLQNNLHISYLLHLSLFLLNSLLPLVLAIYPGRDDDNLYGAPAEPAQTWQQTTAFFVVALAVVGLLYQTSNSHLQFVLNKARDGKQLSEQDISVIYKALNIKYVSEHNLTMLLKLEAEETGRTNIDRNAFRQHILQQQNAALLKQIRTLQYPLPVADLAGSERSLVSEAELDQFMGAIAHECGCDTTIREVARRELQKRYDDSLRSKLGLPLPE